MVMSPARSVTKNDCADETGRNLPDRLFTPSRKRFNAVAFLTFLILLSLSKIILTCSYRTEELSYPVMKTNRLMLFKETAAVYCENYKKHTDILCGHILARH
jgi:hypothetical protein